jgi:DNA-binding transcriptional LysR family regulator
MGILTAGIKKPEILRPVNGIKITTHITGCYLKAALMRSLRRRLPSLNAMLTFETAARLQSFSKAGLELNVSQAAVSRQIKALENEFGIQLFKRGHRSVTPTPEGELLSRSLSEAFEIVGSTVDRLREVRQPSIIRVGATVAFSHLWLLPRLRCFRDENLGLKLHLVSQDEAFDLRRDDVDIIMRFGTAPFSDGEVVAAITDRIFPVCSPGFAMKLGESRDLKKLLTLPLIGTYWQNTAWMTWPNWFVKVAMTDPSPPLALQFNHYTDAVKAAQEGEGVVLGWNFVIHDLIASGQLVRLTDSVVHSEESYNVVVRHLPRRAPLIRNVARWFGRMFEDCRTQYEIE